MQSTGIPPHVNALVMYERLNRNLLKVGEAVYKACAKTTKDVKDFLEEKAIGLGNVTATHLHNVVNSSLKSVLDTMGLNKDFVQKVTEKTNKTECMLIDEQPQRPIGNWMQLRTQVPQDFTFFKGTLAVAFQHWCCGNPSRECPPLRDLKPELLVNDDMKRRFADLKFMLDMMVKEAKRKGLWIDRPSPAKGLWIDRPSPAEAVYIALKTRHCLKIPSKTQKNRIRRLDQLEWTTCAKLVREAHTKKPRRGANSA
jgi:hypothetical protein